MSRAPVRPMLPRSSDVSKQTSGVAEELVSRGAVLAHPFRGCIPRVTARLGLLSTHCGQLVVVAACGPRPGQQRTSFNSFFDATQPLGRRVVVRKMFDCTVNQSCECLEVSFDLTEEMVRSPVSVACHRCYPRRNEEGPSSQIKWRALCQGHAVAGAPRACRRTLSQHWGLVCSITTPIC